MKTLFKRVYICIVNRWIGKAKKKRGVMGKGREKNGGETKEKEEKSIPNVSTLMEEICRRFFVFEETR